MLDSLIQQMNKAFRVTEALLGSKHHLMCWGYSSEKYIHEIPLLRVQQDMGVRGGAGDGGLGMRGQ
jgi:hypothetical protein